MKKQCRYNILALDVATKTGWRSPTSYGLWDLTVKRDESKGMRLVRLKSKLLEMVEIEKINLIAFESVVGIFKASLISESELLSVVKLICEENNIEYRSYAPSEIKRHATGKGNANKDMMVAAAKEKLGYDGDSNDIADAMWIYDLTFKDYNS